MRAILIFAILTASSPAPASSPPTFGCPTSMLEQHQFDFWIGHWEVRNPQDQVVGHSRIESINDGCGIAEHWQGSSGSNGASYNAWDTGTKHWQQFWIDNSGGPTLWLTGGIDHGKMVLGGTQTNPKTGKPQLQRITWTPNADGSVRQHWEQSGDSGKTWTTSFDGLYRKEAK